MPEFEIQLHPLDRAIPIGLECSSSGSHEPSPLRVTRRMRRSRYGGAVSRRTPFARNQPASLRRRPARTARPRDDGVTVSFVEFFRQAGEPARNAKTRENFPRVSPNRVTKCGRKDLNLHARRHQLLRLACLPIPPHPHINLLYVIESTLASVAKCFTFLHT